MEEGFVLDSGVLQGINRETAPNTPLADWLRQQHEGDRRLVTIREVMAECIDVPAALLDGLGILVEPTAQPSGSPELLDAFSSHPRSVWWRTDHLARADRAVVGHAIARRYDVVTTDAAMKERSFREFLRRLDQRADDRLPAWYLPEIIVVQRGLWH